MDSIKSCENNVAFFLLLQLDRCCTVNSFSLRSFAELMTNGILYFLHEVMSELRIRALDTKLKPWSNGTVSPCILILWLHLLQARLVFTFWKINIVDHQLVHFVHTTAPYYIKHNEHNRL